MPDKITKFISALDEKVRKKLKEKLLEINGNPFGVNGIKKLKGWGGNAFRIRLGKIRIIYRVIDKQVEIIDIDYRGNIY